MSDNRQKESSLIKFEGTPNELDNPKELTTWQKFKRGFWDWARNTGILAERAKDLGDAYAEAEVDKKESEAAKFAAEASEAAARADQTKQETVKVVNEEIRRIFSDDESSEKAKMLQLANLLANNPKLKEQLQNIEEMYKRLQAVEGMKMNVQVGDQEKLLEEERSENE